MQRIYNKIFALFLSNLVQSHSNSGLKQLASGFIKPIFDERLRDWGATMIFCAREHSRKYCLAFSDSRRAQANEDIPARDFHAKLLASEPAAIHVRPE
jgi:hypothetical protein